MRRDDSISSISIQRMWCRQSFGDTSIDRRFWRMIIFWLGVVADLRLYHTKKTMTDCRMVDGKLNRLEFADSGTHTFESLLLCMTYSPLTEMFVRQCHSDHNVM